jgi:acetyltransferase-like isoleucine patch superfamily enzyme
MSVTLHKLSVAKLLAALKGAAVLPLKASSVGRLGRIAGRLSISNKGKLMLGRNVSFHAKPLPSSVTVAKGGCLTVGDNVFFNYGLDIGCWKSIKIGSNTIIGPMVNLIDTNFHPVDASAPMSYKEIVIEDNVWIGRGAVILPGVTIGAGSVVAAGSVVTHSIPERVLAGGVPAMVIRELNVPHGWIRRYN